MTDEISTTGGAIMTFCGMGFGIGIITSFFNSDLGAKIMVYAGAGMAITLIVVIMAYLLKEI